MKQSKNLNLEARCAFSSSLFQEKVICEHRRSPMLLFMSLSINFAKKKEIEVLEQGPSIPLYLAVEAHNKALVAGEEIFQTSQRTCT